MNCLTCNAPLPEQGRFCPACGARRPAPEATLIAHPTLAAPVAQRETIVAPILPAGVPLYGEALRLEGHPEQVTCVAFLPDGRFALSGCRGGKLCLWDLLYQREVRRWGGHASWVTAIAIAGERTAVSTGLDPFLRVWSLADGSEVRAIRTTGVMNGAVALSPDGRRVVAGDEGEPIRMWDMATGSELQRFSGCREAISSLTFSPDGRYLLSGERGVDAGNDHIRLWEVATGREVRQYGDMLWGIEQAAFSPDGRLIAGASLEGYVTIIDTASGREVRRIQAHAGNAYSVAFTPDGQRMLSSGGTDDIGEDLRREFGIDNSVRLWDVTTGQELARFTGHTGNVLRVAVSPDGRSALSGSADRTVRLWRLPS
jgi:WD40 repeat protein